MFGIPNKLTYSVQYRADKALGTDYGEVHRRLQVASGYVYAIPLHIMRETILRDIRSIFGKAK